MTEKPILFSGAMVQAILEGRKTQTRRVMKEPWRVYLPRAVRGDGPFAGTRAEPGIYEAEHNRYGAVSVKATSNGHLLGIKPAEFEWVCPYGALGDRLWVRETWAPISPDEEWRPIKECNIEYKADEAKGNDEAPKWRPSIFMPRWASRITLEVVNVRVERVQQITDDDAIEEGVDRTNTSIPTYAIQRYRKLWDEINAKRGYSWESNPWVWAISFKRIG